ncbi:MAG: prepilin-type N-terminal cleavage/methylation domain-containing protein [Candidatus Binatia bacterium]
MTRVKAGFSLIEVLVAMVIFSIVSLATNSLVLHSMAAISDNSLASEAIAVAQSRIERMRTMPYNAIDSTACVPNSVTSSKGHTTFTVVCQVYADTPAVGLKKIRVTINWTYKGVSKSYATETIYTRITRS